MKIQCPKCGMLVTSDHLNVGADIAVCVRCNEFFPLSSLIDAGHYFQDTDFVEPPPGTWFERTATGWTLGASTRSLRALALVPIAGAVTWLTGMLLHGAASTTRIDPVFAVFETGLAVLSLVFIALAAMSLCGKVVITVDKGGGRIFTGIGPVGWNESFDWETITQVKELGKDEYRTGSWEPALVLTGSTFVEFGSQLTRARRYFVLQTLRRLLAYRSTSRG